MKDWLLSLIAAAAIVWIVIWTAYVFIWAFY